MHFTSLCNEATEHKATGLEVLQSRNLGPDYLVSRPSSVTACAPSFWASAPSSVILGLYSTYLVGILERLSEWILIKHLKMCLAPIKLFVKINCYYEVCCMCLTLYLTTLLHVSTCSVFPIVFNIVSYLARGIVVVNPYYIPMLLPGAGDMQRQVRLPKVKTPKLEVNGVRR